MYNPSLMKENRYQQRKRFERKHHMKMLTVVLSCLGDFISGFCSFYTFSTFPKFPTMNMHYFQTWKIYYLNSCLIFTTTCSLSVLLS